MELYGMVEVYVVSHTGQADDVSPQVGQAVGCRR